MSVALSFSSSPDMQIHGVSSAFPGEGYRPSSSLADFLKNGVPKLPSAHKTKPTKVLAYHVPKSSEHLLQVKKGCRHVLEHAFYQMSLCKLCHCSIFYLFCTTVYALRNYIC